MRRKTKKLTSKQQELKELWENILAKYTTKTPAEVRALLAEPIKEMPVYRRETPYVPSLKMTVVDNCPKKEPLQYTGNAVIGIAVQHKSCLQPIFSQESAIDSAKMRR